MIGRLHHRAGVYISAALLFAGLALAAQATQPVTRSEMESFVLGTVGAAGAMVFGAFWILLNTINGRSEKALIASVNRLEHAVEKMVAAMETHNSDPLAHAAASEHNHTPMEAATDRIEANQAVMARKLDELRAEHDRRACPSDGRQWDGTERRGRGYR